MIYLRLLSCFWLHQRVRKLMLVGERVFVLV